MIVNDSKAIEQSFDISAASLYTSLDQSKALFAHPFAQKNT
jgi:hypothetical protein